MKRKSLKLAISFILVMIVSCDEPETVVTDVVHPDGSVTRKIEMRNMENKFKIKNIQVPFDSTWTVRDSLEIDKKGDTTWIKRADKFFASTVELNKAYQADSGNNREISRRAEFRKKFKWFNTEYKFAEIIDKELSNSYPVSDFLNEEELKWFYSPNDITHEKLTGPDSLKYKAFEETLNKKKDRWALKCLASEWINSFVRLTEGKAGSDLSLESLKKHEDDLVKLAETEENNEKFDSLWKNGIILKEFLGETNAQKFKTEADSAASLAIERVFFSFHEYTVKMIMPGKLTGTNGFIDSTGIMRWPVKSDYFTTQTYEMWAESKTSNQWTWIVSGIFILFVIAGIIFKSIKKG
jgi:hypothetical protein